jgi:hypothetical protein
MAEAVGFEPTKGVNPCQFSRLVHSTALPRLHANENTFLREICKKKIVFHQFLFSKGRKPNQNAKTPPIMA